jgi:hypothetical protein
VQFLFKTFCSKGLKPTSGQKYSDLCKVIKVYVAEAMSWMMEHEPETFKTTTDMGLARTPHLTLLSLLTIAESKMAKVAPPSSLARNITLQKQVLL